MKLYLWIIGIAMGVIAAVNLAFSTAVWYYVILGVVWCTALCFAMDGAVAFLINKLPDRWFGIDNRLFFVSEFEMSFYKRIKTRRWKDKVWELGGLGGFSKKVLKEPDDPAYIEKFIVECNKGVLTHRIAYPLGFLTMLTMWNVCSLTIALPVAIVNLFLNILPTIVLRYNTPKLKAMLKRLRRKQGVLLGK